MWWCSRVLGRVQGRRVVLTTVVVAVVRLTHPRGHRLQLFTQTVLPSWSAAVITSCQVVHRCTATQLTFQLACCISYLFVGVCIASEAPDKCQQLKSIKVIGVWKCVATSRRLDPGAGLDRPRRVSSWECSWRGGVCMLLLCTIVIFDSCVKCRVEIIWIVESETFFSGCC